MPHAAQRCSVARLVPYRTRKVPEVYRLSVGDEEGFAVDTLVVERNAGEAFVGMEERDSSEHVAVCDILDVGEVEQVGVLADLELGLSFAVCAYHLREQLYVAFAEDTSGTDGAGQEVGGVLRMAVRLEDGRLGVGLVYR